MNLDYSKQLKAHEEFAKIYLEKLKKRKFAAKKFSFYTFYKNTFQIVPSNLGIVFPGFLATTQERREIFPLHSLHKGD